MTTETTYMTLKECHEINDDNVRDYRWALTNGDAYAAYVKEQANVISESMKMGQSLISMGEMLRELYYATHKYITAFDYELDLPGVDHFKRVATEAYNAITYIQGINAVTEEFASCSLSCMDTVDTSYM